ncbi:MAG: hypothetical protein ACI841_004602, partial [Planctomycetota bacterium]
MTKTPLPVQLTLNSPGDSALAAQRIKTRSAYWLPKVTLAICLSLLLGEGAARLLTSAPEGEPARFKRFTLLPYQPTADSIERWSAGMHSNDQIVLDPQLGWTIGPNCSDPWYRSNAQAIRADPKRVFDHSLPSDRVRIMTVGDSFTYSDDGPLEATWQTQLERLDAGLEVVNMGVPGYGTDQSLLRWERDGRPFASHIVALGIWPENLCRNLNQNRYYLTLSPDYGFKPRFIFDEENFQLIEPPEWTVESLCATLKNPLDATSLSHEAWLLAHEPGYASWMNSRLLRMGVSLWNYKHRRDLRQQIYDGHNPEALAVTLAIAHRFRTGVRDVGSIPLVILFPMKDLLERYGEHGSLPITKELIAAGHDVLDLAPVFRERVLHDEAESLFQGGQASGHLTEVGNAIVAEAIRNHVQQVMSKNTNGFPARVTGGRPPQASENQNKPP